MSKIKTFLTIMVIVPGIFLLCSCNPAADETRSATRLLLENLLGYDMEDQVANFLESDVLHVDTTTQIGTIHADAATATFSAELIDPNSVNGPSSYNDITLTRYIVSYSRSDGNNVEGVDIPYAFEGHLSTMVAVGESTDINFTIVRAIAKDEPPLVNLQTGRADGVLTVTAKVDFYGHDQASRNVTVSGYLTIHFANYAND